MKNLILILTIVSVCPINAWALDSLSYSGRLVNSNGSPVSGPVSLRFDLSSTNDSSTTLCSKTISGVPLSNGVFHVKLKFDPPDCGGETLQNVMEAVPSGHNMTYQVTDTTNSRTYAVQNMYAVPSSYMANYAKNLPQMGALQDQVLKWDDTLKRWTPGIGGTGNGSVTTIHTGSGLVGGPITNSGTISVEPGGITNAHLAGGIDLAKLAGTRDGTNYLKGDNTWGTFASDVLNTILNGFSAASSSVVLATDNILTAIGKLQGQATDLSNNKLDKTGGTLTVGTINGVPTPVFPDQIVNKQYVDNQLGGVTSSQWIDAAPHIYFNAGNVGVGTGTPSEKLDVVGNIAVTGRLRFKDSGSNYVELRAPVTTAGVTFTLPANDGTNGQFLKTDGSGNLSWDNTSVSSTDITDGSIVDADVSATANIAQSKIAGLTTALDGKEPDIAPGTNAQYWRGDKTWQTLNTDVVPEGATNKYYSSTLARGAISASSPISYNSGTGVIGMVGGTTGDLLQYNGSAWVPWAPNFLTSEADTLATVTGRGATTTTAVTFDGGARFPNFGIWNASGSVGIGTLTPRSALEVIGGIQIGNDGLACGASKVGTLRYNSGNVQYCNGTSWLTFGVSGSGITDINGSSVGSHSFAVPGSTGASPNWVTTPATGVHTLNIPMASGAGVTAGLLSKTDYDAFSSKLGTATSLTGDVSGTYNATSVDKIKGTTVTISSLTSGNFLKYNGTAWVNAMLGASDIPNLDAAKITTGVLPVSRGGTNTSSLSGNRIMVSTPAAIVEAPALTNGQLLIGSTGNTPVAATITAGTGVTVTNSPGGITIAASGSGGTVTNVTGTAPINVATGSTTPVISISQASATTNGFLSSTDWNIFNNKQDALIAGATINNVIYPATPAQNLQVSNTPINLTDVVNKQYVDGFGQWGTSAGNVYRTSGNVGIGTSSPTSALEVVGQVKITGGSPGAGKVLTSDASGLASWTTIAPGGVTSVTGTAPVTVTGTTTPVVSISQANTTTDGYLSSTDWNTFNNKQSPLSAGATINGVTYPANGTLPLQTTVAPLNLTDVVNLQALNTAITGAQVWTTSGSNIYNNNSGDVGIGTTTPTAKLHVEKNGSTFKADLFAQDSAVVVSATGSGGGSDPYAGVMARTYRNGETGSESYFQVWGTGGTPGAHSPFAANSSIGSFSFGANYTTGASTATQAVARIVGLTGANFTSGDREGIMAFYTSDGGVGDTERMRIDNLGNVGIGTTSPGAKLEVAGQVKITGGSPGAGKVLTSDAAGLATWTTPSAGATNLNALTDADTPGTANVFVGTNAGNPSVTGSGNTALGYGALDIITSGNGNVAFGNGAGDQITTGGQNVAIGYNANDNADLSQSVAIGAYALAPTASVAIGHSARSTGSNTVLVGKNSSLEGSQSVGIGYGVSDNGATEAGMNVLIGYNVGYGSTLGSTNVIIGNDAGNSFAYGSNNILIGNNAEAPSASTSNHLNIGDALFGNLSTGNIGIGTNAPGAKLEVAGQVKITGGSPGAGKVLTSDATGLATWTTPASGSGDFMKDGSVAMTGQFKAIDGNSTTPSITFAADTGTGFFRVGNYAIGLRTTSHGNLWSMGNSIISTQTGGAGITRTAGTETSPAFLFQGDADTGMFSPTQEVLAFTTNGLEKVRITSTGNVGIGTNNPGAKLEVAGQVKITGGIPGVGKVLTSDADGLATWETPSGGISGSGTATYIPKFTAAGTIGNSTILEDGSSRVGIGGSPSNYRLEVINNVNNLHGIWVKNSNNGTSSGSQIALSIGSLNNVGGNLAINGSAANADLANRLALFTQPTTVTGISIAARNAGQDVRFYTGGTFEKMRLDSSGNLLIGTTTANSVLTVAGVVTPSVDNTHTLGNATYRWSAVHAANGTIQTSDKRLKKDISGLSLGEGFINSLNPVQYRWKDEGDNKIHFGFIAQDIDKKLRDQRIGSNGIVNYDKDADRFGVNYSELIAPIVKSLQELFQRVLLVERRSQKVVDEHVELKKEIERLKAENNKLTEENEENRERLERIEKLILQKQNN
ncbi:tail fiber domain-containing protein [Peredibacter sp. HCB2-198]|uniref:tail fiber domain-containing protein n=1 Tax=Peredibacter sp. HCB2-198 TaxID=3383025 RepID=UPI0038B56F2A